MSKDNRGTRDTALDAVRHFLQQYPEIARDVEKAAFLAQGHSIQDFVNRNEFFKYYGLSAKEVFTKIYEDHAWGRLEHNRAAYISGTGSHLAHIVAPYVDAIGSMAGELGAKLSALDLGCGDFNIGSQVRRFFGDYIACDIVEPVIKQNIRYFSHLDVEFRVLDFVEEEFPSADVIFVRQVFQHLSNAQIARALRKIQKRCRYLVVTEHTPPWGTFEPNMDKLGGSAARIAFNSGVVLTCEPFNLVPRAERVLCEVAYLGGLIRTVLYTLE